MRLVISKAGKLGADPVLTVGGCWLIVLMGGSCLRSQFHLHPFRALTPSPTFHIPPFMPLTIYAFYTISYLVVLILFLFNLSHVLLNLCVCTHPNFTTTALSSPHFPPPVISYNRHSTGIRIPVKNTNIEKVKRKANYSKVKKTQMRGNTEQNSRILNIISMYCPTMLFHFLP